MTWNPFRRRPLHVHGVAVGVLDDEPDRITLHLSDCQSRDATVSLSHATAAHLFGATLAMIRHHHGHEAAHQFGQDAAAAAAKAHHAVQHAHHTPCCQAGHHTGGVEHTCDNSDTHGS